MHSSIFLGAVGFSIVALADISIDISQADRVASDFVSYISSVTANPAYQSDISAIASAIPSSVIAAANRNPEAFAQALITATALPAWVSAIPTPALDSLESLAAKPVKAYEDVGSFVGSIVTAPAFSSIDSVLATAIPSSVVAQLASNPESFIEAQFTATGPPAYITGLPGAVQSTIGSYINQGLSIVASDLEASSTPRISLSTKKPTKTSSYSASGTGTAKGTGKSTSRYTGSGTARASGTGAARGTGTSTYKPTGTGAARSSGAGAARSSGTGAIKASGTGAYYTGGASNSPLAFRGAGSSVAVNSIGAGVLATFCIFLALL